MRKSAISTILAGSISILSMPSHAATTFMTGTVISVFTAAGIGTPAESVDFTMSFPNQTTGCPSTNQSANQQVFVFTPADISDAQTRKNMLTVILAARTSGLPLTVVFDNAGAHCDATGFPVPTSVGM
jgi:hypothetical protein